MEKFNVQFTARNGDVYLRARSCDLRQHCTIFCGVNNSDL